MSTINQIYIFTFPMHGRCNDASDDDNDDDDGDDDDDDDHTCRIKIF